MPNPDFSLKGLVVLVVDSDLDSREILKVLLEMCQAEPVIVSTVYEAKNILENIIPDLLISELTLTDDDSLMLMRQVSVLQRQRNQLIPAIALTVHARREDYQDALSAGFQRHIAKPFEFEALMMAIAELLDRAI